MITLDSASDEQLLLELIKRNGKDQAASRVIRHGEWYETFVEIGSDYSASLTMSDEDYRALMDSEL